MTTYLDSEYVDSDVGGDAYEDVNGCQILVKPNLRRFFTSRWKGTCSGIEEKYKEFFLMFCVNKK